MTIHFWNDHVSVKKGEMIVIPKGEKHKTSAMNECRAMLVETAGTVYTGAAGGDKTAPAMLGSSFSAINGIKTDGLYLGVSLNASRCSSTWLQYCAGSSTRPPLILQSYARN